MTTPSSTQGKVVLAALAGNLAVALTKFVAAALTGSAAMFSEGIHSAVDTTNELLLLYGMKRAQRARDGSHPFGYGRELYFWSFIVALLVFALGALMSFYEGLAHLRNPVPLERPIVAYVVLGLSFAFEASSWLVALKEFRATKGALGYFEAFQRSKDASTFTVLFEDTAAMLGLLIAFAGIASARVFDMPQLDAYASFGIALVLAIASTLLARETKGLLIGEAAPVRVRRSVLAIASADPSIRTANGVLTAQIAPNQIVAALSAEFEDALTTPEIEACVMRIEEAIRRAHPDIFLVFVKPQTSEVWRTRTSNLGNLFDDA